MNSELFNFHYIFSIIKKHRTLALYVITICVGTFIAASFLIPKQYKSTMVISIYAKYFQNPLIREFVSETYDSTEMRSQRESVIRLAFNEAFIDDLAQKLGFMSPHADAKQKAYDRNLFSQRIEVLSINATTFQIGFKSEDPEISFRATSALLEQIQKTLVTERRKTIANLRNAVRERLESMSFTFDKNIADPLATMRPELLKAELNRLQIQVQGLLNRYTSQHPSVVKLQKRIHLINQWLEKKKEEINSKEKDPSFLGGQPEEASMEIYTDLLKKFNYLNIALEMENSEQISYLGIVEAPKLPVTPFWPKKSLFAVWGLMVGLLMSSFSILIAHYIYLNRLWAQKLSTELNVPFLGEIPKLRWIFNQES